MNSPSFVFSYIDSLYPLNLDFFDVKTFSPYPFRILATIYPLPHVSNFYRFHNHKITQIVPSHRDVLSDYTTYFIKPTNSVTLPLVFPVVLSRFFINFSRIVVFL